MGSKCWAQSSFRSVEWIGFDDEIDSEISFSFETLITGARQEAMRLVVERKGKPKHVDIPGKLSRELSKTPESAGESIDLFITKNEDGTINYEFRYGISNQRVWRQPTPGALFAP